MQWFEKQKVAVNVNVILMETEICLGLSRNSTTTPLLCDNFKTTYYILAFSYKYHLLNINNVKKKKMESNTEIVLLYIGHKVILFCFW